MRWTPDERAEMFATPELINGDLWINCEVIVAGSCCDDLTNFWWMLRSVSTRDQADISRLSRRWWRPAARSGLVFFTQPAFDPGPDGVFLAGQGQLKIEVQSPINS